MPSVTGIDFTNLLNIGRNITQTQAEYILDGAIDLLNIFDVQLSNMTGTAGSKTVTLTSKQRGGVFAVARIIYESYYKSGGTVTLGGLTIAKEELMSNPVVMGMVEKIATRLQVDDDARIPFIVATDESGLS